MAGGSVAKLGTFAYAGTFKLYTFFPWWFLFFLLPNCWLCLILGKLPPTCCTMLHHRRQPTPRGGKQCQDHGGRKGESRLSFAGLQNLC